MLLVDVLSHECDRVLRHVRVQLGHVQVVHELDQVEVACRCEVLAALLQRAHELVLQQHGIGVEVEV